MQHLTITEDLMRRLLETERFTMCRDNMYRQKLSLWNCMICGCSGNSATEAAQKTKTRPNQRVRVTGGIQTFQEPVTKLTRALCCKCSDPKKRNLTLEDHQVAKFIEVYIEEHWLYRSRRPNVYQRPSVLATANCGIMSASGEQTFGEPSSIPIPSETSNIELIDNFSLQLVEEQQQQPQPPQYQEDLFQQMPVLNFLLNYGHQGDRIFNFAFLDLFNHKQRLPSEPSPSDRMTISPRSFLLLDSNELVGSDLNCLLKTWTSFSLFFLHQLRLNSVQNFVLSGEPAYFELKSLPNFNWTTNPTDVFITDINQHIAVLQKHASVANEEKHQLLRLMDEFLDQTVTFDMLFNFLVADTFSIRSTSQLFARYFFHFPERIQTMNLCDTFSFFLALSPNEICDYQSFCTALTPASSLQTKKRGFKLSVRSARH